MRIILKYIFHLYYYNIIEEKILEENIIWGKDTLKDLKISYLHGKIISRHFDIRKIFIHSGIRI